MTNDKIKEKDVLTECIIAWIKPKIERELKEEKELRKKKKSNKKVIVDDRKKV